MIIDLTRKTIKETYNPMRRFITVTPWGAKREYEVKISQPDQLRIWR